MSAWCLDVHAGWRCRHTGACCTAGWAIPVEEAAFERLAIHFGRTRNHQPLFVTGGFLPEAAAALLGRTRRGECVFFDGAGGRLCAVHRDLGPDCLPVACRQFPRIAFHDARGTFVTLSHFCPTAAELLLDARGVKGIEAPPYIALEGKVEGLDAVGVLPPLLRPGLLSDIEGYAAWEQRALDVLAEDDLTAEAALALIGAATGALDRWRPGNGSLAEAVDRAFSAATPELPPAEIALDSSHRLLAIDSIPAGLARPPHVACTRAGWNAVSRWWPSFDPVVRAWLAARLFGNWIAYSGQGLGTVVEYLRMSLSVLKIEAVREEQEGARRPEHRRLVEAIRAADLLLVHLSDAGRLASELGLRTGGSGGREKKRCSCSLTSAPLGSPPLRSAPLLPT